MSELAEVVHGELVQDDPAGEPEPLFVVPRRVKESVLKRVATKTVDGTEYPGSTLTAAAQAAGIDPDTLREACALALRQDRSNPNREFALKLYQAMADREDFLARKGFDLATAKKDAAFFRVALERQHEDWKPAPKGGGTVIQNNVTIVDKLQMAQRLRANPSLPTGD